jgi:hypothetical protein
LSAAFRLETGDSWTVAELAHGAATVDRETGSKLGLAGILALLAKLESQRMIYPYLCLHRVSS